MNEYELYNFKSQKKFTQTIFEDSMMILLDSILLSGVLSAPVVTKSFINEGVLFWQVLTTCASLYFRIKNLIFESNALNEEFSEYLLVCLKGKQGWIPFGA